MRHASKLRGIKMSGKVVPFSNKISSDQSRLERMIVSAFHRLSLCSRREELPSCMFNCPI